MIMGDEDVSGFIIVVCCLEQDRMLSLGQSCCQGPESWLLLACCAGSCSDVQSIPEFVCLFCELVCSYIYTNVDKCAWTMCGCVHRLNSCH